MPDSPDSPPSSPKLPLAPAKASAELQATAKQDVVLLHGPTEDGEGIRVLRARTEPPEAQSREGRSESASGQPACVLEVGEVRPLKEGMPIAGEVVRLTPRAGASRVCDVEVMAKVDPAAARGKGPAQVATHAYRASWERIFGPETREDAPPHRSNRVLN